MSGWQRGAHRDICMLPDLAVRLVCAAELPPACYKHYAAGYMALCTSAFLNSICIGPMCAH